MRGVYYRTEKDGTPLATPELRISATNNRTVYYDNQNAKEAALQSGEIKEGSIVLTGYADGESEVVIKQQPDWENAVQITGAQLETGYVCPSDGMIVGYSYVNNIDGVYEITVNSVTVSSCWRATPAYSFLNVQCQVNKDDLVKSERLMNVCLISFVPFKTVAEPLTLPVNVMNNPSLPDWNRAINITAAQLQAGYVCPNNGIVCTSGHPAVDARGYVSVNGHNIASGLAGSSGYRECQVQITVGKNDVVRTIDGSNNGQLWTFHSTPLFIPFKN